MKTTMKLALAASAIALTTGTPAMATDITVTSWGGGYTASQQRVYGVSWESKTGNKINWENYNSGLGEVRAMVEAGNAKWDLVDVLPDQIRAGCDEGFFEEVPA